VAAALVSGPRLSHDLQLCLHLRLQQVSSYCKFQTEGSGKLLKQTEVGDKLKSLNRLKTEVSSLNRLETVVSNLNILQPVSN
jgi:hypothetical protein